MKVLVFGNSDTRGEMIDGDTWPVVGCRLYGDATGESVELADRLFLPWGTDPLGRAEQLVNEEAPDAVVIPAVLYGFLVGTVEEQVRHLFGDRAAGAYKAVERWTDGATGTGTFLNGFSRKAMRRLVGTRMITSMPEVRRIYLDVMRMLAQQEQLQVVIMTSANLHGNLHLRTPARRRVRANFHAALREETASRHFDWLDGDEAIAGHELGSDIITSGTPDPRLPAKQQRQGRYPSVGPRRHVHNSPQARRPRQPVRR